MHEKENTFNKFVSMLFRMGEGVSKYKQITKKYEGPFYPKTNYEGYCHFITNTKYDNDLSVCVFVANEPNAQWAHSILIFSRSCTRRVLNNPRNTRPSSKGPLHSRM